MHPYLHILIRVEKNGSLHAIGAFTTKDKQLAYQKASGLPNEQVRFDFYNGTFDAGIQVIYAGHCRWNTHKFQLAGYFLREQEAWASVTQDGYVNVLKVDSTYAEEKALEDEALRRYAKLQSNWRLSTYDELISREGEDKARANIKLRFYEDALESFEPKTRRDVSALYAYALFFLSLPLAVFFFLNDGPDYGENLASVSWLPDYIHDISYYHSKQVQVFEFKVSDEDFKRWAESRGMTVRRLTNQEVISRYKAYIPAPNIKSATSKTATPAPGTEQFGAWRREISARINQGLIAESPDEAIAILDSENNQAYFKHLIN